MTIRRPTSVLSAKVNTVSCRPNVKFAVRVYIYMCVCMYNTVVAFRNYDIIIKD